MGPPRYTLRMQNSFFRFACRLNVCFLAQEIPVRAPSRWIPVLDRFILRTQHSQWCTETQKSSVLCCPGVEDED